MNTLNVAVIGAGPAGIYASDILARAGVHARIDLFEQQPAPYGLVRYGVAPDHPRIKQIIVALYKILARGEMRLLGNVEVGRDLSVAELRRRYDAVVFATGADRDRGLAIPGIGLPESYGAADFVSWYDGNPDYPRTWPLTARTVAVIGVGNVALDISRMLTKHVEDLMPTEIPANVAAGLAANRIEALHIFGRRGPAQAKFTPLELRELGRTRDVDVVADEADFVYDRASQQALRASNQQRQVVRALTAYASADPGQLTASRRIHIHLFQSPAAVLADAEGHVRALRTERTELAGGGRVRATGRFHDWPVQAVYRAVGYASSPVQGVPFDPARGVIPNAGGRVVPAPGEGRSRAVPGLYVTGWAKRGPVGLIGSTKSDAQETIGNLLEDARSGRLGAHAPADHVTDLLERRGVAYTTWRGWELLDAYERRLGHDFGPLPGGVLRERVKVVSRAAMSEISREGRTLAPGEGPRDLIGHPGELGKPTALERLGTAYTGPRDDQVAAGRRA